MTFGIADLLEANLELQHVHTPFSDKVALVAAVHVGDLPPPCFE